MPLTLDETWALQTNQALNNRIRAAIALEAKRVLRVDVVGVTPNYEARRALALRMIQAPDLGPFAFQIYTHNKLQNNGGSQATDDQITDAVRALWDAAATGVPDTTP